MQRPPTESFFLVTKRVTFTFIWAVAWFAIVFLSLIAFELAVVDPFHLVVSDEPDGRSGFFWWRQTVSHIMLSAMRRVSSSSSSSSVEAAQQQSNEATQKEAIAAQSLLALKEVTASRFDNSIPIDDNFPRESWNGLLRSHYPQLEWMYRIMASMFNLSPSPSSSSSSLSSNIIISSSPNSNSNSEEDTTTTTATAVVVLDELETRHRSSRKHFGGLTHLADARMPSHCGSFVFIDGSSLGTQQYGAYSVGVGSIARKQYSQKQQRQQQRQKQAEEEDGEEEQGKKSTHHHHKSLLFENFLYCGTKRNSPSEIGRRLDEYFKSCAPSSSSSSSVAAVLLKHPKIVHVANSDSSKEEQEEVDETRHQNHHQHRVECISPGMLLLTLLERKMSKNHHNNNDHCKLSSFDKGRVMMLDLGSGSEIVSTIAVSALHGYRQSIRLAKTRQFKRELKRAHVMMNGQEQQQRFNNNNHNDLRSGGRKQQQHQQHQQQQKQQNADFGNDAFTNFVIAPPALVVSVDMANPDDRVTALDGTRVTRVPSNQKLFSGSHRRDFFDGDPDRVKSLTINTAIGGRNEQKLNQIKSSSQTFYVMRTHSFLQRPKAVNVLQQQQQFPSFYSSSGFTVSPRIFQCFIKQQEELPNGNNNNKQDIEESSSILTSPVLSHEAWTDISDYQFYRRLLPHSNSNFYSSSSEVVNEFQQDQQKQQQHKQQQVLSSSKKKKKSKSKNKKSSKQQKVFLSNIKKFRDAYDDSHHVRMTPKSVSAIIDEAEEWNRANTKHLDRLNGDRLSYMLNPETRSDVVAFLDVGGHDSNELDCGMALSQLEIIESISEAIQSGHHHNNKKSSSSFDAVVVLRPLSFSSFSSSSTSSSKKFMKRNWCFSCQFEEATKIAQKTVEALVSGNAIITSTCTSTTVTSFHQQQQQQQEAHHSNVEMKRGNKKIPQFSSLKKNPMTKQMIFDFLLQHFLQNNNNNKKNKNKKDSTTTQQQSYNSFCTLWLSNSGGGNQQQQLQNNHNNNDIIIPTLEELSELTNAASFLKERFDDDKNVGFIDTTKQGMMTALEEAAKDESDIIDEDDASGDDSSDKNNKGKKKSKGFSEGSILLVALAIAVAFFLIRGVLRNFKSAGKDKK